MLRIGQKVTQIRPFRWGQHGYNEALPQFGAVYTVRAINLYRSEAYLLFYEIRNPICDYSAGTFEMDFYAKEFRPIVDRPTDISIFEEMLTKEPQLA